MSSAVRFWPHVPDENVASTRIRCLQVVDGLVDAGVDAALFDPLEPAPAVLVLVKRYDPDTLARAETLRRHHGTRIVLDLCDNHFHHDPADTAWSRRADSLRVACASADLVVAASDELARVVSEQVPGARVLVVPDSLDRLATAPAGDLDLVARLHAWRWRGFAWRHPVADGRRLLWFGNRGFPNADGGMVDLRLVDHFLREHHARQALTLCVISNSWDTFRRVSRAWKFPAFYLPWSKANFRLALDEHDIALIPLQDNAFTRCKTNNRLATAFTHGLAVAAGKLPAYEEFRDVAVLEDWGLGLEMLMSDKVQRQSRIEVARQRLARDYSVPAVARRWAQVLRQNIGLASSGVRLEMEMS